MAMNSRRIRLAIIISLCAILLIGAVCWFFFVPKIIENKVNSELEQVSLKTGRHFEISNIRLHGLTHAGVDRVTISDVNHPEREGVSFSDIRISLSGLPIGEFSIASIDIDELNVNLRKENGQTNFEDVLSKLRSMSAETTEKAAEPKAWKRYITPFPTIHVSEIALSMPTVRLNDKLELGAVSANNLNVSVNGETGYYEIDTNISANLIESGAPVTYESHLQGSVKNGHDGRISVAMPRSEKNEIPEILKMTSVSFEQASFILPTTFEIDGFQVVENNKVLIHADKARARLMTLPPKKVSGVYFKEVELVHPEIHDYLTKDGSAIFNWVSQIISTALDAWNSDVKEAAKKKVEDVAVEAAAAAAGAALKAAVEGSENAGQEVTDAVLDSVHESIKPERNPRDFFFSQRMFITDGAFSVDDQITGIASTSIDKIQVEVGYRSIRRVLDYRIDMTASEPVSSNMVLSGQYDLPSEYLKGKIVINPMHASSGFKKMQASLQELNAKTPDDVSFWQRMIPAVDLDETEFETVIDFDYSQKTRVLNLDSTMSLNHFAWRMDALSQEPTVFTGTLKAQFMADFAQHIYDFKNVSLNTSGAAFDLGVKLDHQPRPQVKTKQAKPLSDLHFNVFADIPVQEMQTLFDAIPHALRTELDGLSWKGTLGIHFDANGYLDTLSETQHKFSIVPSEDFEILEWPAGRNVNALNSGMKYTVQDPNAVSPEPHEIVIPPSIYPIYKGEFPVFNPRLTAEDIRMNYPDWVLFDDLNPWLIQLITTTEDGSFFTHEGFSALQVKAALERNVNRQAFSRGASTISMQLVKNIFFNRNKTISRKFQEVLYTWLMESVVQIPKKRIMELYFNIIEFGPEIYGIEEAAKYYFGKRSRDLSLKESAFLIAIIPSPRKGANHRSKPALENWLQKTMNFYIQEMYRRKCDPDALAKSRARLEKQGKSMIYEPCCPPKDSLQLMLEADTMSFYIPNPGDPSQYAYRPELYTPDGTLLIPRQTTTCGYHGDIDEGAVDEQESIFVPFPAIP